MILILSGPIRSGKTTTLMHWSSDRQDIGGVLSPDADGLRKLYNVWDNTSLAWQKETSDSDSDQQIGRFVFDHEAFLRAQHWLDNHLANPKLSCIILDEIGPLELSGKGWDVWLRKALPFPDDKTLILVVREQLTEAVVEAYSLQGARIVTKDYFTIR